MTRILETFGEEETRAFGKSLGETAVPGQVICLDGDLGVGKTVLAQGFAAGLGIEGPVASPTFTIRPYGLLCRKAPLCHSEEPAKPPTRNPPNLADARSLQFRVYSYEFAGGERLSFKSRSDLFLKRCRRQLITAAQPHHSSKL